MAQRTPDIPVEHDEERRRFFVALPDGDAELVYDELSEDLLDFQHTEVPASARGAGVGDALVRAGLAFAREHGRRVVATCPYVRRWLVAHPEERP